MIVQMDTSPTPAAPFIQKVRPGVKFTTEEKNADGRMETKEWIVDKVYRHTVLAHTNHNRRSFSYGDLKSMGME